jgi:hypothetical protein
VMGAATLPATNASRHSADLRQVAGRGVQMRLRPAFDCARSPLHFFAQHALVSRMDQI